MDRPIEENVRNRRRLAGLARLALAAAVLVLALLALRMLIRPSVAASDLRFATVEAGPMVAAIDVTGRVVAFSETVISAPFASELREIIAAAGTTVSAGDPILDLEVRPLVAEIAQLEEQIALKANERRSRELTLAKALNDTRGRYDLQQIDLESHRARRDRLERLADIGAISKGELLEAQLDVRRGEVRLAQLEEELSHLAESHEAELERIDLETSILASQLAEKERLRKLATVRAPHAGVVTWVVEDLGAAVAGGSNLARVADLSRFRVEATASDYYADEITAGQRADIEVGERRHAGRVTSVLPGETPGTLRLLLALDDASAQGLRPNLRADVLLEIDRAERTLFVRRGPGTQGRGETPLFRVEDGQAVRVPVRLGFANRDRVQILEGLAAGDQVILSSTEEFRHLESITVRP